MDKSKAYSILGLAEGAGEEAIKTAYRNLAQHYTSAEYTSGVSPQEAEDKMNELNEAFDLLINLWRTDAPPVATTTAPSSGPQDFGRYAAIRQLINSGRADEALSELSAVPHGAADAEWNFLMGSVYYYKGWLNQALQYFQEAVRLEPSNQEYQAALRNLTSSAGGQMPGNPYSTPDSGEAAMNCACNTCTMMCCMDMCCSMCRG